MNQKDLKSPYSRRDFLKTSSACGLASAASGVMLPLVASPVRAAPGASPKPAPEGKVVWSACTVNCGSRCPLRMHVVDGRIRWVETDNLGQDIYGDHQVRACARGRSMRQRVYNADRLKYPMKRVGKRGEGKFERISWDEAYTLIAKSLQETIAKYGNEAVYIRSCLVNTYRNLASVILTIATRTKFSAVAVSTSTSLASRRKLPSQANVRSTTHRFGNTAKPSLILVEMWHCRFNTSCTNFNVVPRYPASAEKACSVGHFSTVRANRDGAPLVSCTLAA